jgi:hypothetical protein
MKSRNIKLLTELYIVPLLFAGLLSSCKKEGSSRETDGGAQKITVTQVTLHNKTTTTQVITQAMVGTLIRLDGSGFATATAIYCNGVKVNVNPNFVAETNIIMTIPSTLPFGNDVKNEAVRNTIRIVTKYDDFTYKFIIQGPMPVVTNVSHSLPKAGETFKIYGTNLRDITKIVFPGDITLTAGQFQLSTDYTTVTCTLPTGATTTAGGINIQSDNGQAYSYNYMNRREGIFIQQFANDANKCYNYGTNISATQTAILPQTGDGHKSPDFYRQVPAAPATAAVETTVGGFNFRPDVGMTSVLQTSNGTITNATSCDTLALQFDVYIPVEWSSGWLRIDFISGNTNWRYNYAPWAVAGKVVPVQMSGWQTVTMPLGAFKALTNQTFGYFITQTAAAAGVFSFVNGTYTDAGGATYAPKAIAGFQMSFGNFRVVPYVKRK